MNLKRSLTILLGIGMFCFYLVTNSDAKHSGNGLSSTQDLPELLVTRSTTTPSDPRPLISKAARDAAEMLSSPLAKLASPLKLELEPLAVPLPPPPVEVAAPLPEPKKAPPAAYRDVWAMVTAYCPCRRCCGRFSNGRTSIGVSAWKPGIAADPKALSYGTKIDVPGYGIAYVDDTGIAMRRSWRSNGMLHLDLRMTYHWQAREWGTQIMQVRIYRSGFQE